MKIVGRGFYCFGIDNSLSMCYNKMENNDLRMTYWKLMICVTLREVIMLKSSKVKSVSRRKYFALFIAFSIFMQVLLLGFGVSPFQVGATTFDNSDLSNFITRIEVADANGLEVIGDFRYGEVYIFTIDYSERAGSAGQFAYNGGGRLTYQLPHDLEVVTPLTDGVIRVDNGSVIGRYTITASGAVEVWFGEFLKDGAATPNNENFIDYYTDAGFSLEIEAQFREGTGGKTISFGLNASIDVNVANPPLDVRLVKSSAYISAAETINYTLIITAPDSNTAPLTDIILFDTPFRRTSATGNKSYINAAAQNAFTSFVYWKNDEATPTSLSVGTDVIWNSDNNGTGRRGFSIDFDELGVTLDHGDTITVQYSLSLRSLVEAQGSAWGHRLQYSFFAGNNATVTTNSPTASAETQNSVSRTFISKSHSKSTVDGNEVVNWTAWVGNGSEALGDKEIVDTLSPSIAGFLAPENITITLYNSQTSFTSATRVGSRDFTAAELSDYVVISGNTLTFDVPKVNDTLTFSGGSVTAPEIYRVQFKYRTETPTSYTTFRNDITYNDTVPLSTYSSYTLTAPGPATPTLGKASSKIREVMGVYVIDYTVTIGVPAGLKDDNFYYRDYLFLTGVGANKGVPNNPNNYNIAISPPPSGTEPEFLYNRVFNANESQYDIFFGAADANQSTTKWQYDDAKTITITYTIPLLQPVDGANTLQDYLKSDKAYRLRNEASIRRGGTLYRNAYTDDTWPIHKVGAGTNNYAEFDFTVYLNYNQPYSVFSSAPVFTDVFDSRLEFKTGSFYVLRNDGSRLDVEESYIDIKSNSNGTTTMTVDFSKIAPPNPQWWNISYSYRYDIHYTLIVKEYDELKDTQDINNSVTINATALGNVDFSNDATVTFSRRPVRKEMLTDGSNIAEVVIIVNPCGETLNYGNVILAEDEMSDSLTFFMNSIKFFTQGKDGGGNWDGIWIPQEKETWAYVGGSPPLPAAPWSVKGIDSRTVHFGLPDATPAKIVYTALITAPAGDQTSFSNTVKVLGYTGEYSADTYRVQHISAHAAANRSEVHLIKADENNPLNLLGGAEFDLYMHIASNDPYNGTAANPITINGRSFYPVQSKITDDASGIAPFDSNWLTPSHKAVYLLHETAAPDGYEIEDEYTFFVLHAMNYSEAEALEAALGSSVQFIADTIHITNARIPFITPENATIEGNKSVTGTPPTARSFNFNAAEVTEKGGSTLVADGFTGTGARSGAGVFEIVVEGLTGTTAGTEYFFRITEDQDGDGVGGWTYSKAEFWVTVTVTDDGFGDSSFIVDYDGQSINFVNIYQYTTPENATIEGNKSVTGTPPTARNFNFNAAEVTEKNGSTLVADGFTGTGARSGAGVFEIVVEGLTGTTAGTEYFFRITEDQDGDGVGGWTYSKAEFWVTVTVTDDGFGNSSFIVDYNGQNINFVNIYQYTTPENATIEGNKSVTGTPPTARSFNFNAAEVTEKNGSTLVTGGFTGTGARSGAGVFEIVVEGLTGTTDGTEYFFRITEDQDGDGVGGWTYSKAEFWVTVTVTDDGFGDSSFIVDYDGQSIEFVNTYVEPSTSRPPPSTRRTLPTTTTPPVPTIPPVTTTTPLPATTPPPPVTATPPPVTATPPPVTTIPPVVTMIPPVTIEEITDDATVSIHINKILLDSYGNPVDEVKYFAIRIYDESMNLIDRFDLINGQSLIINGLEGGTTYYLQEEQVGGFNAVGFEIAGAGAAEGAVVGVRIPEFEVGYLELQVDLTNSAYDISIIPDMPIPRGVYQFPEDPPIIEIPDSMIPRGAMQFPDDTNPRTGITLLLPGLCAAAAIGVSALAVKRRRSIK
jgi:hypothetical protein